jgi:hypothetical protein
MAALNFPNSPSVNDEYTANGYNWVWDGTSWNAKGFDLGALAFLDEVSEDELANTIDLGSIA